MLAMPLIIEIPKHYIRDASEIIAQSPVGDFDESTQYDLVNRSFWKSGRVWAVFSAGFPKTFEFCRQVPRSAYEMANIADTLQDIYDLENDPDLDSESKPTRRAVSLTLKTLSDAFAISLWTIPRGQAVDDFGGIWVSWRAGMLSVGLRIHATDDSRDRVYFDDGQNFRSEKPPTGRNLSLMLKNLTVQELDAPAAQLGRALIPSVN